MKILRPAPAALGVMLGAAGVLETEDHPHEHRDADGDVERSLDAFHPLID
jgi:hypothetical protein